jgi:geranylgeranyl diphosphate synthase type II
LTASGLELFQNWILIHDDIEDQSDLRRGLPALHKKFGSELAINAGDALHGKMWEMLLSNEKTLGPDLTIDVLTEFSQMLNETTEGQQMELSWTVGGNWDISEMQYLLMVTKKASWYTCISPSRLGILLSTSGSVRKKKIILEISDMMEKTIQFGTDLGIAFQIVDDVLNLTAEEAKYGKEILGDLFEGKRTLMLIHLLKSLGREERNRIIQVLSKPRQMKTLREMESILERMKTFGSIRYARDVAARHSKEALRQFEDIVVGRKAERPEAYQTTKSLLEYLSSRDY